MTYADELEARNRHIRGLFELYNSRRFVEMLAYFRDDVVCFLPTLVGEAADELRWSYGKAQYAANLAAFHDTFGSLKVEGIFATETGSSVLVIDSLGNSGSFSFEVDAGRRVKRIFFNHQQALRSAAA